MNKFDFLIVCVCVFDKITCRQYATSLSLGECIRHEEFFHRDDTVWQFVQFLDVDGDIPHPMKKKESEDNKQN
jgi:hypothetical protein